MASLFNQTKQNISLHINNCFNHEQLDTNGLNKLPVIYPEMEDYNVFLGVEQVEKQI